MITAHISSAKMNGTIDIVFDAAGNEIEKIDFSSSDATLEQKYFLLKTITKSIADNKQFSFHDLELLIIETKVLSLEVVYAEATFETFWESYPNKIGKVDAQKIFAKLSSLDKWIALNSVKPYIAYLQKTGFRNPKDGDAYLRKEFFKTDFKALSKQYK